MAEFANEFEEVLLKSVEGDTAFFLTESQFKDDKLVGSVKINEKVSDRCKPYFQLTSKYVYLNLEFQFEKDIELKSYHHMFHQFLEMQTRAIKGNLEKYYILTATISKVEDGIAYVIELTNPIFCFPDENKLVFIFETDSMNFGKVGIDMAEVEAEVDYEIKVRTEQMISDNEYLNSDSDLFEEGATD